MPNFSNDAYGKEARKNSNLENYEGPEPLSSLRVKLAQANGTSPYPLEYAPKGTLRELSQARERIQKLEELVNQTSKDMVLVRREDLKQGVDIVDRSGRFLCDPRWLTRLKAALDLGQEAPEPEVAKATED